MALAPGSSRKSFYGTGPAGKTQKHTMGQGHAVDQITPQGKAIPLSRRGSIARGGLGKRGR